MKINFDIERSPHDRGLRYGFDQVLRPAASERVVVWEPEFQSPPVPAFFYEDGSNKRPPFGMETRMRPFFQTHVRFLPKHQNLIPTCTVCGSVRCHSLGLPRLSLVLLHKPVFHVQIISN